MAQNKQNANLALWESVQTTDKKFTKEAQLDGRTVTSINGTYMAKRATEEFGPIGKGWGFDILVDRLDQGAPILGKDGAVIAHELMHTIQLKLWYVRAGKRNSVTHYGHTPFVRKSQYGAYTDFDAPKKSLTDAMKKCLSLIGFSADVHLGMFDDQTYLEGLELKKRLEDAGDPESAMDEAKEDFKAWLRSQLEALKTAPNVRALNLMRKQIAEKARAKAVVVKFDPAYIEARIDEVADDHQRSFEPNPPAQ
ncbi:hypothetical protein [Pseudomonas sp. USHLN015]|uniref:hypothetical protein n=1 Tax=Pseudomonas sp. USHLN015 TaxID=3081296 RepID=UPI00301D94E7